jgi:protein ImuA
VEVSPAAPVASTVAARQTGPSLNPESLHPALWRAAQLGRATAAGLPTGFAALDAELPGGGWPTQALTELLLPHPGVGEWRLLAPVLAALQRGRGDRVRDLPRSVMLFDPPAQPCAWTLGALGLDLAQIVIVQGRAAPRGRARLGVALPGLDTLWALEQALASGQVGAVLAWLPARLRGDALRRLQLAAQAHPGPAFLLREVSARLKPSAAPLRLLLTPGVPDELRLRVLKRRGPPLSEPLALALPPVLCATAHERALRSTQPAGPLGLPQPSSVVAA